MGVESLNFGQDFLQIGGPPPHSLTFLESPWGGLQALKIVWAKVEKQKKLKFLKHYVP